MHRGTATGDARARDALEDLANLFGDRVKRGPLPQDALALVLPRSAEEVVGLTEVAARHSLPLVAQGAGTGEGAAAPQDAVLVRFDLMGSVRLPGGDEPWVEAEPGATLLSLENNLEARGVGLAVYPTSAPRATVGGWLAGEGIGVGSFEYGRLPENVVSAEVVLAGGERATVQGPELPGMLHGDPGGLLVGARLRTRPASDAPFAAAFEDVDGLVGAAQRLAGAPLWHLAFLNAGMSSARGLGKDPILFGAYPRERSSAVEEALAVALDERSGRALTAADTHRVWGQRFFPVAPSHPTPEAERKVVPLAEVPAALRSEERPVQGTVSRSGDVLLLMLDAPR